jgi:chemotaxis regulatin CheY-phosphate phosphatase CheZ
MATKEIQMKEIDYDVLSRKAEELRALFILGQKLIPFLDDIFRFVSDAKPLLDDAHLAIHENLDKMQNASRQLTRVTQATELATTEIISIVDGLIHKSEVIASKMKRLNELNSMKFDTPLHVLEMVHKAAAEKKDMKDCASQLSDAIAKLKSVKSNEYKELFESTGELLKSINDDSNAIMLSLQVQDITSQQIAAVDHLLDMMQNRIGNILVKFKSSPGSSPVREEKASEKTVITMLHRPIAFSPAAIDASADNKEDTSYFTQDDINVLFGKQ